MLGYFYTLTTNRDLLPDEIMGLAQWFARNCDSALVVEERGANGKLHLHATTQQKQKSTNQCTRMMKSCYEQLRIPWTDRVSCRIKKTTDQIGSFHYLTKDLIEGQEPILIFGWEMTWIQEQCRDNLKKIPHKMVRGDDYVVNMVIAPNLLCSYAKRSGICMAGKEGFKEVVCRMASEGYQFHNVKWRILYCEIMARCGDTKPMRSLIDNELQFLE